MRKLLIVLVVLAALFVVGDFAARAYAESRAATALQNSFDLSKKPSVSLAGFPFLVHLTSGSFSSISLSDTDFRAKGVAVRAVDLTLHDVRFSAAAMIGGRRGTVEVNRGDGTASLTGDAMSALLQEQSAPVTIRFSGGKAILSSGTIPGSIEGTISFRNGHIVIGGQGQSFAVPLPQIIPGITYTAAHVEGDAVVVTFEVGKHTFHL
jgi:hypothetical protein